jgi:outer membrane receptor protein involved in Fe transport
MEENGVVSPYAGIVYDLNEQYSLYASYSDIFKPQTEKSRSGSVLEPIVGANYEVGVKGEFLNKRLNTAAAVFRLEQTIVSQGVDLSLNGALTPNWNIGLGLTYVKSQYAAGEEKGDPYNTVVPQACVPRIHHLSRSRHGLDGGRQSPGAKRCLCSVDKWKNRTEPLCPGRPAGKIPDQPANGTHRHRRQPVRQEILVSEQWCCKPLWRAAAVRGEFEGPVLSGQGKDMGAFAPKGGGGLLLRYAPRNDEGLGAGALLWAGVSSLRARTGRDNIRPQKIVVLEERGQTPRLGEHVAEHIAKTHRQS